MKTDGRCLFVFTPLLSAFLLLFLASTTMAAPIGVPSEERRAELFFKNAVAAIAAKDFTNARQLLDAALAGKPAFPDALVKRAALKMREGNELSALQDLEQALLIEPNNRQALSLAAAAMKKIGQFDFALRLYRRLEELGAAGEDIRPIIEALERLTEGQAL